MSTLYELSEDILKIEAMFNEADGDADLSEALREALDQQTEAFEDKASNIYALMLNWGSDIDAIKAEETRLATRRKVLVNRANHLRAYLLAHMQKTGKTKVEFPLGSFTVAKGREAVIVDDDMELPQGYFETEISIRAKKADLKKLWDETPENERGSLPGFHVERGEPSLRVK